MVLTYEEVAELLGVHQMTLRRWVREGGFVAPRRIGPNTTRFLEDEVRACLARKPATHEAADDDEADAEAVTTEA